MITIRKLESLPPKTRIRKAAALLQGLELTVQESGSVDSRYAADLLRLLGREDELPEEIRDRFSEFAEGVKRDGIDIREINACRHLILRFLGTEPADWDFISPSESDPTSGLDTRSVMIFPFGLYLEDLRSPFNVGSIFRTAAAFGVSRMFLSQDTADPGSRRAARAAMGAVDLIPWERRSPDWLDGQQDVFAVELGGVSVAEFRFPDQGIAVFGSEELGCSPEILGVADAGRITIPLYGAKGSLNVGVACGIVLQAWTEQYRSRYPDREERYTARRTGRRGV